MRHYLLGQSEILPSMSQAEGIWRAKVVLTGSPMEGSVLSLMRTHKHFGLLAFNFLVFSQHSGVGFFDVPLTNGMQAARSAIWSAHSFSSSSIVATVATASEATTMQNNLSFLLPIFLRVVDDFLFFLGFDAVAFSFWCAFSLAFGVGSARRAS